MTGRFNRFLRPLRNRATAAIVLVAGLVGSLWWSTQAYDSERAAAAEALRNRVSERALTLQERMHAFEQILLGATGLFLTTDTPTREQWRAHALHIGLRERYAGAFGLGFADAIGASALAAHTATQRAGGIAEYRVWPTGVRAQYAPVIYLEPQDAKNRGVLGYDILSEPARAAAAQRACDEGRIVMTEPIVLLQDDGTRIPGAMLIAPVYRPGHPLENVEQRRSALRGWAYIPFRTREFIESTLGTSAHADDMRVYAGNPQRALQLFGADAAVPATRGTAPAESRFAVPISFAGVTWKVVADVSGLPHISVRPTLILALGGFGTLMLFAFTLALSRNRDDAQKRAEEAHTFLEAIIDAVPVPLFVKDDQQRAVLVNTAHCRMLGRSKEDIVGKHDRDLYAPERLDTIARHDAQALASEQPIFYEDEIAPPGGQMRWTLKAKTAMRLPDGRKFLVGIINDIADRKRAELETQAARELVNAVLDASPSPLMVKDEKGRWLFVNEVGARFLGGRVEDFIGKTPFDVYGEAAAHRADAGDRQALESDDVVKSEGEIFAIDGSVRWGIKHKRAIDLPDGRRVILVSMTDLTERRAFELEAARSKEFLDQIINASPQPMFVKDAQQRLVVVNDAFCEMIGKQRDALIGRSDEDYVCGDWAKAARARDERVLATLATLRIEFQDPRPGKERWLLQIKSGVQLSDGARYVVGLNVDITETKRAVLEAERSQRFLDAVLSAIPIPVFVKDRAHRYVKVNEAFAQTLGGDTEWLIGKSDFDVLVEEVSRVNWEEDDRAFEQGERVVVVQKYESTAGRKGWFLKNKLAISLGEGEQYVVGASTDITAQKEAALEVERSRTFLDAIINSMPQDVYVKDEQGRWLIVNDHICKGFGVSRERLLGTMPEDLFPSEVAQYIRDEDARAWSSDRPAIYEHLAQTPMRAGRWLLKMKYVITAADGRRYMVGVNTDITERKRAERAIADSRAALLISQAHLGVLNRITGAMARGAGLIDVLDTALGALGAEMPYLRLSYASIEPGAVLAVQGSKPSTALRSLAGLRVDLTALPGIRTEWEARESWQSNLQAPAAYWAGAAHGEVLAFADVPVRVRGEIVGVLSAHADSARAFATHELRLLAEAAEYLSLAIETERAALQRAHAERRLRNFFDLSADPLCIANVDGYMVEISPAMTAMLGRSEREVTERPLLEYVHPDDRERTSAAMDQLRRGEPVIDFVNRWQRHDGSARWLQWRTSAPDVDGQIYAVARDITESRQRELLVEHTHEMAKVGGWELDLLTGALSWTDQTFRIHDTTAETYTPTLETALDFYLPDDRILIADAVRRGMENGQGWDLVLNLRTAKGRHVIVRAQGLVEFDRGRPVRAFGAFQDVTDLKGAEQELRRHRDHLQDLVNERTREVEEARDAAVRANRAKTEFLTNMSHELRTPLHGILSFARLGGDNVLKKDGFPKEKTAQYFQRIQQSGERLLVLLDDLLDLSRLEAGKMRYEMTECDIDLIAESAISDLSALALSKSLRVAVDSRTSDTRVWGDTMRLGQVLRNLIGNAIKFSPDGGRIAIVIDATEWEGHNVAMLSVLDEGVGIPPEELGAIFNKFVQSSKTKSGAGGTGLGLAICKRVIADHHGVIWAENRSEGGAAFCVLLPRKAPLSDVPNSTLRAST